MNRLWVRFSLTIIGVAFILVTLPLLYRGLIEIGLLAEPAPPGDDPFLRLRELVPPELALELREIIIGQAWFVFTRLILGAALVGVITGILLSRGLTRPLQALETGAHALAERRLGHRVPVGGSAEIRSVAVAFNQMADELEEAEARRRNLLADVAHELRHPLHVIQGNLQAILDGVYPLTTEEIARLSDQAQQLTRLVDDLHLLAQAEARQLPLERQALNLALLAEDAVASFAPLAEQKGVALHLELLGRHPSIDGDAARIRQILGNLLSNALRHTPVSGAIRVEVEVRDGSAELRVTDDGAGIAPDALPHLFDRFYRADGTRSRATGGTGLGLAISQAIAAAHDGSLTAASAGLGRGATFTLRLPSLEHRAAA